MNLDRYKLLRHELNTNICQHELFKEAHRRLYSYAGLATPGNVVIFCGPPRAGKSTVGESVSKELIKDLHEDNPDHIPIILIEAVNAKDGLFSMKHLTLRGLEECHHPIMKNVGSMDPDTYVPRTSFEETYLRIAFEKALKYRKTLYVVIDEASHLTIGRSIDRASNVLDSIKCLGNTTKIILILITGYSLLKHLFTSAHLTGRARIVEFRHYNNTTRHIYYFDCLLETITPFVPLKKGKSLLDFREMLLTGSVGTFGLLIEWLETAMSAMAVDNARYLNKCYLERTRIQKQIDAIRDDIKMGEECLEKLDLSVEIDFAELRERASKKSRSRKPFQRKPHRDHVGQ
jgi:hypothetical protein